MDAPLQGDTGGHAGAAPTNLHHIFPCIPHKQNNHSTRNPPKRHQPSARNLPKRNRRGGACVPARTSAQRRFHTKNIRIVREDFNDGCALAGRNGRAYRRLPYQSSSYFSTQSHTNKITIYAQSTQTKPTVPTNLHQTTRCAITSSHCTFDSSKPCGVPLPHRGYTFDSAGLASATRPTLGNSAREEATPLGVVLFPPHYFLMSSTHTSGAEMHRALPPPFFEIKKCVYRYSFGVTVASP